MGTIDENGVCVFLAETALRHAETNDPRWIVLKSPWLDGANYGPLSRHVTDVRFICPPTGSIQLQLLGINLLPLPFESNIDRIELLDGFYRAHLRLVTVHPSAARATSYILREPFRYTRNSLRRYAKLGLSSKNWRELPRGLTYKDVIPERTYKGLTGSGKRYGVERPAEEMPNYLGAIHVRLSAAYCHRLQNVERVALCDPMSAHWGESVCRACSTAELRRGFETLWDSVHGSGDWTANPWVLSAQLHRPL